jgi:lipoate-protein ligase B
MNNMKIMNKDIEVIDWGVVEYLEAWNRQRELFDMDVKLKSEGKTSFNKLILCEHLPVITLGKSGHKENLLINGDILKKDNIEYVEIDRGGDITFHGPGQIVGYPIFDIENFSMGLKNYVWTIEEAIIRVLSLYNINGERSAGASGVWIDVGKPGERKICALGIKSSRYVTMHGFAFNINTDLRYFSLINPCGFADKGVTSLEKELGHKVDIEIVKEQLKKAFTELFV